MSSIYSLAVLLPSIGVAIRRMHDTNRSGWWILIVSLALTAAMLGATRELHWERLFTFGNFSGDAGGGMFPRMENLGWLFALGLGMGLTCIGLSLRYKAPILTAWSTPGAALKPPSVKKSGQSIDPSIVELVSPMLCPWCSVFHQITE